MKSSNWREPSGYYRQPIEDVYEDSYVNRMTEYEILMT